MSSSSKKHTWHRGRGRGGGTVGKRRGCNVVGTLDEAADSVSGTLAQQVNQMDQKNKTCSHLRCKNNTLWLCDTRLPGDTLYLRNTLNQLPVGWRVFFFFKMFAFVVKMYSVAHFSFSLTQNHTELSWIRVWTDHTEQTKAQTHPLPTKQYKQGSPLWSDRGHEA